jgi:hypothetical protein
VLPPWDSETLKYLLLVLQLLNGAGMVVLFLRKPGQDAMSAVTMLATDVSVLRERLANTANKADLSELNGRVLVTLTQIQSVQEQLVATRSSLLRIEEWLRQER